MTLEDGRVVCYFDQSEEEALMKIKPGDVMVIWGKCEGRHRNRVVLKDCAIQILTPLNR